LGRGIEWVIDAMPYLENAVFCIAGDGDKIDFIKQQITEKKLEDRVILLGRIPLEKLHEYTCSADLGISLLDNLGLNYYYSLPNRIFDFVQAGVPVLATDFPEIRLVVEQYGIGELITDYSPKNLAQTIQSTLSHWEQKTDKREIFDRAKKELCWENEEKTILNLFNKVV
jgi:glycosyltransferase involved in cell wall biosynthesis